MRLLLAVALTSSAFVSTAAIAEDSGSFVVLLGSDTLSVERVTRTASQVRGEYVARSPRTSYRTYTMDLRPDGTILRFEMVTRNLSPGPGRAETRTTMDFDGDTVTVVIPRGDSSATMRIAAGPGAVPFVVGVMGLIEQLGHQARAAGGKNYTVSYPTPGGGPRAPIATVTSGGGDTLVLSVVTATGSVPPYHFTLDRAGRLQWFSGAGSTFQAEAARVSAVDLAAAQAAFANRPLGQLSARDTVRAQIGGADLQIDYGRPSKRGRVIFGNVVPWNTVWRTGANAATQFRTSADLLIGDATVPAGTYTLWSLPAPGGWKLILNKQTGQWGTEYHVEQDLARVDLRVEKRSQPVEKFTIEVVPQDAGGSLRMSWDGTQVSVPVRRKE